MGIYSYDKRLDEICRDHGWWASARLPGLCWILDNVLGINPNAVPENGWTKEGIELFELDIDGRRLRDDCGDSITTFRKWTPEEKALLKEWEDFIPTWMRNA